MHNGSRGTLCGRLAIGLEPGLIRLAGIASSFSTDLRLSHTKGFTRRANAHGRRRNSPTRCVQEH